MIIWMPDNDSFNIAVPCFEIPLPDSSSTLRDVRSRQRGVWGRGREVSVGGIREVHVG